MTELRKLVSTGAHSATSIAKELSERFSIAPALTRCAVIGKCSRTGISLAAKTGTTPTKEVRKTKEPRIVAQRAVPARLRTPSEAMLALPSDIPPNGIAISSSHRVNLVLAAKAHEHYHQAIVDRCTLLEEMEMSEDGTAPPPPTPVYPGYISQYWSDAGPMSLMEKESKDCSYITARSSGGESHYCGHPVTGDSRMCKWHQRLCHMPVKH